MPIYVTNPLDRPVTLYADDGHTVQVPPKVREAKVHAKFAGGVPSSCRVLDKGERSRAERLDGFGLAEPSEEPEPSAELEATPLPPFVDDSADGVEVDAPSGAGPP